MSPILLDTLSKVNRRVIDHGVSAWFNFTFTYVNGHANLRLATMSWALIGAQLYCLETLDLLKNMSIP